MPYSNAKKKQLALAKRRGSGSISGSSAAARRPATSTTSKTANTDGTTSNNSSNGNVNNNGRVNVAPAKASNSVAAAAAAKRTNNRSNSSGCATKTKLIKPTSSKAASLNNKNRRNSKNQQIIDTSDQEDDDQEEEPEEEEEEVDSAEEEEETGEELVGKKIGKLSVSGGGGGVAVVLSGSSEDGEGSSSPQSVTSEEDGSVSEECQSFFVIVNPDGSLLLNNSNSNQLTIDKDQELIPVNLPKHKIKSLANPLPGAIQLPPARARKSKPEGVTYGGSTDVGFIGIPTTPQPVASTSSNSSSVIKTTAATNTIEVQLLSGTAKEVSMSVGINPAHVVQPQSQISSSSIPGTTGSIDMDEFTNQLDPQSLATLENLIQSAQGNDIININTLDLDHVSNVHMSEGVDSVDAKPPGWDHSYPGRDKDSSASVSVSSTTSSAANSPGGSRNPGRSSLAARSSSAGKDRNSSGGRLSECDGNIRRSQRQQDRIERQEAERIMLENQQMLQREKEIMKEASAQKIVSVSTAPVVTEPSSLAASPVSVPVVPKAITPAMRVASPVSHQVSVRVASPDSDSKRPYPKRENRKLPAHLADPNYINLEDEGGIRNSKDGASSEKSAGSRRSSTHTKHEEPEEEEEPSEIGDAGGIGDDDDEDYTEDDPNRLWCICHQPHNNRFMICCDKCEDWFHGKCVNVTKAQGKAMELKNIPWNCPPCRKILAERKKAAETPPNRGRAVARRASEATSVKSTGKLSKAAVAQQAEAAAAASAAKLAQTPEKIAAQSTTSSKRVHARKSESDKGSEEVNVLDCVVCGKSARTDSIYCSDLCVQKFSSTLASKSAAEQTPTTPISTSPGKDKLKRTNSLRPEPKSDEPIFAFHVITPGATKSTEVVPPKPKELTASQLLKAQREQAAAAATSPATSPTKTVNSTASAVINPVVASSHPTVQGVSPNSVNAIMSSTPTVVVKKMTTADGKSFVKLPGKISKESPLRIDTSDDKTKGRAKDKESTTTRARAGSASTSTDGKNKPVVTRKSSLKSSEKEKEQPAREREGHGIMSEKLHRENMRKGLRELLKNRLKEMSEDEQREISARSNTPDILAEKIEEELTRVHGGASNPKCRAKYRSIYFNLKDSKNCLYQEILNGNLKPKVLVKMEPHELASAELSEWRKRESEKDLDAIKKAELDKYAEAKKIQLLEKGVDDAVMVAEESRPLDISDIIDTNAVEKDTDTEKGEKSKSSSSSHSHHSKSRTKESRSSEKEKERERRDKDRRRSDRHKADKDKESSSSKDKDRRTRGKEKESYKVKHSDSKDRDRKHSKGKESDKSKSVSTKEEHSKSPTDSEHKKYIDSETTTSTNTSGDVTPSSSQATPSDTKKSDVRHSTDSEQEQPSSTIKTPDFADEASVMKKESDSKPMFQTRIVMPELGGFNASAHAVSHYTTEGLSFPESPVHIVGRIGPDTVWDYINKMKKSKEVIVYRLSPATPTDSEGYMTFFSYFSSRQRLGVIGNITSPLKDVYLVPLDKHSPVNRALMPFGGPGLPKERTHCLLCVVTRHVQGDVSVPMPLKRKSTVSDQLAAAGKKKGKFVPEKQRPKVSTRSTSSAATDIPALSKLVKPETKEDDDAPYTPWEEDDDKDEVKVIPSTSKDLITPAVGTPPVDVQKQLQELEAKIAKERQDIEKITGALAGKRSGIPGLDGEFPDEDEESEKKDVQFFLRMPVDESQEKQVKVAKEMSILPGFDTPDSGNSSTNVPSKESKKVVPDTSPDVIIEDSSSLDSEPSKPADTPMEDLEEAYSPSAMQFSDEETPDAEEKPSEVIKTQPVDIIEEDEPLPPGIEPTIVAEIKSVVGKFIPITEPPVDDIKIVMRKPVVTSPLSQASTISGSPVTRVVKDFIDLGDDDLEPPPPGDVLPTPAPVFKKLEPVFEEVRPVFSKSLTTGTTISPITQSKMKININLTTKQLPSKPDVKEKKEVKEPLAIVSKPIVPPKDNSVQITTTPSVSSQQPSISFPIHLPPPNLQHPPPPNLCPPLNLNLQQPPPGLQPQTLPHIPVHIPPPSIKAVPTTVPTSVVINLNVPPPPLMNMMSRPMPPVTTMGFRPQRPGFTNVPPPPPPPPLSQMGMRPNQCPPFVPSFNEGANVDPRLSLPGGSSGPSSMERDHKRGFDRSSPEVDRVERINLDRDNNRRDRDRSSNHGRSREIRGRNFGRRPFGRDTSERIRRNRSRSRSNERDRSRSRSRERRHRRRSKSRSKSPLSKRWEARNKSRSRSPAGKRSRHRSRSPSPSSRRHHKSGSPRKNSTKSGSNSRSKSPSTPKARHSSSTGDQHGSEDWEAPSPPRTDESSAVEKQTSESVGDAV